MATPSKKVIKIKAQKLGANMIINFGAERYARKVTMDEGAIIFKKAEMYDKKPSDKLKNDIITLMTPTVAKQKQELEKAKMQLKGAKKLDKKEAEGNKKEKAKEKVKLTTAIGKSKSKGKELLALTREGMSLIGFEKVVMPKFLSDRILGALVSGTDIKPLLNFWTLCLQNPNEIARTRLFEYLNRHKFMITPAGYFVTYRMWKMNRDSDNTGIYTDNHTKLMKLKVGEVVSIPREQCDEDGGQDCSRGLHVGSPNFIGIERGEGYRDEDKLELKPAQASANTYNDSRSYGTGYNAPTPPPAKPVYVQKANYYGDQAIIAFVNPAHVVSIPNSETRKLRCCEYYPFKLTTAQEVGDMEEGDFFIFENDYKKVELEQLMAMVDKEKLKSYLSGKSKISVNRTGEFEEKVRNAEMKIGTDIVAKDLDLEDIKKLVNSRLQILKN